VNQIRLIHITPELPPEVGGVADYTAILSRRIGKVSDGVVEPVLVHAGKQRADSISVDFPVVDLSGECSSALLADVINTIAKEAEEQVAVLLEYSGYGFSQRGAPLWLARGLRGVCGGFDGVPLITIFHELYATGPPWTSTFWISGLQRFTAAAVARSSRVIVTNRTESSKWVHRYAPSNVPIHTQPVFSNVGEPDDGLLDQDRSSRAIVFGGGRKKKVYSQEFSHLVNILAQAGITHVTDVGPTVPTPDCTGPLQFEQQGILPKREVSQLLQSSQVGIIHCPTDHLTKSGVMAAYLSHSVAPIVLGENDSEVDLVPRKHYLSGSTLRGESESLDLSEALFRQVGQAGREWYLEQAHSERTGQNLFSFVKQVV
jgi:hypothetical protein